jgi:hypothetical protein
LSCSSSRARITSISVGGIAWTAGRSGFGGLRVIFTALVGTRPHSTARCITPWSIVIVLRIASTPTPAASSSARKRAIVCGVSSRSCRWPSRGSACPFQKLA